MENNKITERERQKLISIQTDKISKKPEKSYKIYIVYPNLAQAINAYNKVAQLTIILFSKFVCV